MPRFHVTPRGQVISPAGFCPRLSRALGLMISEVSHEWRRKFLPRLRAYLNMEMVPGENWRFWHEDTEASWRRQDAFLTGRGHKIGPRRSIDGARQLSHPNAVAGNFDRIMLHRFYDALDAAGLTPRNQTHLPFFAAATMEERIAYIQLMKRRKRQSDQIGRRLLAPKFKPVTSIPVNPIECVAALEADIRLADAPQEVAEINRLLRINGKRPFSILTSSAYGWALKDLGSKVACRNKGRGTALVARFVMPPDTVAALRARLADEPSPLSGERSLLEEVEMQAARLWGADRAAAAEAEEFLSSVALFKRPTAPSSVGGFLSYEGLRYWTLKGRKLRRFRGEAAIVRYSDGRREPNLRDYRRASITRQMLDLHARTKNEAEREAGRLAIARRHDQSFDQSKSYAAFVYAMEEEEKAEAQFAIEMTRAGSYGYAPPPVMHHLRDEALKDEYAFLTSLSPRSEVYSGYCD